MGGQRKAEKMDKYRFSIKTQEEYENEFNASKSSEQRYRDFWRNMGTTLWKSGANLAQLKGYAVEKLGNCEKDEYGNFKNFAEQYVDYSSFELPQEEGAALLTLFKYAATGKPSYKAPALPFNVELISRIV